MKIFSVGLLAFCGILTESFVQSGLLGCLLYGCLCAIGVTLFVIAGGRKAKKWK